MTRRICLLLITLVVALCGAATNRFTLVIDAGHGGHDPGAIGRMSKEKDINLATALEFGRLVKANCPDVEVVYTRTTDKFVTLQGRAQKANQARADLFVSIHTNAMPGGRIARGTETYTLGMARAAANLEVAKRENSVILVESDYQTRYEGFDPNSSESYIIFELIQNQNMAESVSFATQVQSQFRAAGRSDRGVHQAGFLVLRETTMPSVLVELGYITTPDEERFLASSDGQRKLGNSIYQAFLSYYKAHTSDAPAANSSQQNVDDSGKSGDTDDSPTNINDSQNSINDSQANASQDGQSTSPDPASQVEYRVQIASGGRRALSTFGGVKDVAMYEENGTCKYTAGRFATQREAQTYRNAIVKRYPGAFVVAFLDGRRITLDEARRLGR